MLCISQRTQRQFAEKIKIKRFPPVLFSVLCGKKMDYEFSTAMEFAATARDCARRWLMTPTESIPVL